MPWYRGGAHLPPAHFCVAPRIVVSSNPRYVRASEAPGAGSKRLAALRILFHLCSRMPESRIHKETSSFIGGGSGWPIRIRCRRSSWLRVRSNSRLRWVSCRKRRSETSWDRRRPGARLWSRFSVPTPNPSSEFLLRHVQPTVLPIDK
jgi:hypothetical protein